MNGNIALSRRFWLVGLMALSMLVPQPAAAKNMHGKFGIGYQRTLLGVQGLSTTYWLTPRLALLLTAGIGFELYDVLEEGAESARETSTTTLLGAVGIKYALYATKFVNLSVGGRAAIGWASKLAFKKEVEQDAEVSVVDETENNVTQWGLELPLEFEYFFSDAFSINLATGFVFTQVPSLPESLEANRHLYPDSTTILRMEGLGAVAAPGHMGVALGVGGLFGNAGFTFYF